VTVTVTLAKLCKKDFRKLTLTGIIPYGGKSFALDQCLSSCGCPLKPSDGLFTFTY
jgi:hypothetical protein